MIDKYIATESSIVFGEPGFMRKVELLFAKNDRVEVILKGWRNRFLLPYVKELIGYSPKTNQKKSPRFDFFIRLLWLGPLMACYGLALEKKMDVNIIEIREDHFAVIVFERSKPGRLG